MQTYLVGGAVRDKLLGLSVSDRDWVVVGGTPEELLAKGYQQVGKDFPVFLHPDSKEEYALARTERKSSSGYTGFECDASAEVTLEQDLLRRDLTINAIAEDINGELVDPYNGQRDLQDRVLRHVSPAFSEDPLRVLRVARFAARFAHLGFSIAAETLQLMQHMAGQGELETLPAERLWVEIQKALQSPSPQVFISSLREAKALAAILPEVDALFGVPQTASYHPEIDTGEHMLLVLEQAAQLELSPAARYAALLHDLGKGTTPAKELPSHRGHELRSKHLAAAVSKRLKVSAECAAIAELVAEFHLHTHRALELKPQTLLKLLLALDAFRRPTRLDDFLAACEADARGRKGLQNKLYPQAEYIRAVFAACQNINVAELQEQGYSGAQLGEQIHRQRLSAIERVVKAQRSGSA